MAAKQNVGFSAQEEYQFFLKHKKNNYPQDAQYVEDSFKKDPEFKPYYLVGFDGKPNGFIDNPYTMNLVARKVLGLAPLAPGFMAI